MRPPGDVWSFTTREFLVVDDFEAYSGDTEAEREFDPVRSWTANGSQHPGRARVHETRATRREAIPWGAAKSPSAIYGFAVSSTWSWQPIERKGVSPAKSRCGGHLALLQLILSAARVSTGMPSSRKTGNSGSQEGWCRAACSSRGGVGRGKGRTCADGSGRCARHIMSQAQRQDRDRALLFPYQEKGGVGQRKRCQ